MTERTNISRVYFIGIGGIGMSALAGYFLHKGAVVSGYDRTNSRVVEMLEKLGATVHFEDKVDLIDRDADLVVYTPAVPDSHKELTWYREHQYNLKKRSVVLADITSGGYNICIAGTHGKTTMSVMTAHILRHSGYGCNAFLGGISVNYETNFWMSDNHNNVNVVEADEYDRSFLKLHPDVALISAVDADHLDVYGSVENLQTAYREFAALAEEKNGLIISKFGVEFNKEISGNHIRYSLQNSSADVYARNIVMKKGGYEFDIEGTTWSIENLRLNMGGMHNVENMVASVSIAKHLEIDDDEIRRAVASFKGVHRRFEYVIDVAQAAASTHDVILIDDYAHHPEELKALLRGARSLFNNRWMTVVFQPHLYTRTRDLYKEFAEALSIANTVVLLPVYPAREEPIEGVSSGLIAKNITGARVVLRDYNEILQWVEDEYKSMLPRSIDGDLLIIAGAGDVDRIIKPVQKILLKDTLND